MPRNVSSIVDYIPEQTAILNRIADEVLTGVHQMTPEQERDLLDRTARALHHGADPAAIFFGLFWGFCDLEMGPISRALQVRVAQVCLDAGFDINSLNKDGMSAWDFAWQSARDNAGEYAEQLELPQYTIDYRLMCWLYARGASCPWSDQDVMRNLFYCLRQYPQTLPADGVNEVVLESRCIIQRLFDNGFDFSNASRSSSRGQNPCFLVMHIQQPAVACAVLDALACCGVVINADMLAYAKNTNNVASDVVAWFESHCALDSGISASAAAAEAVAVETVSSMHAARWQGRSNLIMARCKRAESAAAMLGGRSAALFAAVQRRELSGLRAHHKAASSAAASESKFSDATNSFGKRPRRN